VSVDEIDISSELKTQLLLLCRRRCCVCFAYHDDLSERPGVFDLIQPPHRATPSVDDVVYLCPVHSRAFRSGPDVSSRKVDEIRHARNALYRRIQAEFPGTDSDEDVTATAVGSGRPEDRPDASTKSIDPVLSPSDYDGLLRIADVTLPFAPTIGSWLAGEEEYAYGDIEIRYDDSPYVLPEEFDGNLVENYFGDDEKCRLSGFYYTLTSSRFPNIPSFQLSPVFYSDYLRSGEYLDSVAPGGSRTFRESFAPAIRITELVQSRLTNICGVGIFLRTSDNMLVLARHSPYVRVSPNQWGFTASGTMDWKDGVNPFEEVARESFEEIGHQVNLDSTRLVCFGTDATRFYVQFGFLEETPLTSDDVLQRAPVARDYGAEVSGLKVVPFQIQGLVDLLLAETWEPSAAASLLLIAAKRFGYRELETGIATRASESRARSIIQQEWSRRAETAGVRAVMSSRISSVTMDAASRDYVAAFMRFMSDAVDGARILEAGSGIGRFSRLLVSRAARLTCVDVSAKMHDRSRAYLKDLAREVEYIEGLIQDYLPSADFDIGISSQVLCHSITPTLFSQAAMVLGGACETIFLAETVNSSESMSPYTRQRSVEELLAAFPEHRMSKMDSYSLDADELVFLRLDRNGRRDDVGRL
jgi:SAM-dependent methyltransferase